MPARLDTKVIALRRAKSPPQWRRSGCDINKISEDPLMEQTRRSVQAPKQFFFVIEQTTARLLVSIIWLRRALHIKSKSVAPEGRKENSQGLSAAARNPWLLAVPNLAPRRGARIITDDINPGVARFARSPLAIFLAPLRGGSLRL
jgi:hypothetical protein